MPGSSARSAHRAPGHVVRHEGDVPAAAAQPQLVESERARFVAEPHDQVARAVLEARFAEDRRMRPRPADLDLATTFLAAFFAVLLAASAGGIAFLAATLSKAPAARFPRVASRFTRGTTPGCIASIGRTRRSISAPISASARRRS